MAEDKNGFLLYADYIHIFEKLNDKEAGQLVKHLFRYVNDENPKAPNRVVELSFVAIKQQLKRDLKAYEKTKVTKSEAGVIGNLKRWHADLYDQFRKKKISLEEAVRIAEDRRGSHCDKNIANIAVNGNDTVTVNVNESEREGDTRAHENLSDEKPEKNSAEKGEASAGIPPKGTWPQSNQTVLPRGPSQPVQRLDQHRAHFVQAVSWQEALCMKHKCRPDELPALFEKFFLHLRTQSKENIPQQEAVSYFDSWMGKNYKPATTSKPKYLDLT